MVSQLTRKGWSMSNWGFGMGGALLQQLNRDTQRFAFKCSAINRNGVWQDVYKEPATDPTKNSKPGRFVVVHNGKNFITMPYSDKIIQTGDRLQTIFENGECMNGTDFATMRKIASTYDEYLTVTA
jgi:nicotinamide phosphoribosyltransferase